MNHSSMAVATESESRPGIRHPPFARQQTTGVLPIDTLQSPRVVTEKLSNFTVSFSFPHIKPQSRCREYVQRPQYAEADPTDSVPPTSRVKQEANDHASGGTMINDESLLSTQRMELLKLQNDWRDQMDQYLTACFIKGRHAAGKSALFRSLKSLSTQSEVSKPLPAQSDAKPPSLVRSYVDLSLNGAIESAVADTGAHESVMSSTLATSLRLKVKQPADGSHVPKFVNPVGKSIKTLGYVCVPCKFRDEAEEIAENRFWILPDLIVPLVVGRKFLDITQSLTRFRHRLRKMTSYNGLGLRALHMELPRQRLNCCIGDSLVQTVPDTGSDLDLMSLSFAQSLHYPIHPLDATRRHVQFADGSTRRLSGKIVVPFSIGSSSIERHWREFCILDGLTSDALLGNGTLEELDAFNAHTGEFVELGAFDPFSDLHYIRWIQRNGEGNFLEVSFGDFEFFPASGGNSSHLMPGSHAARRLLEKLTKRRQGEVVGRCFSFSDSQARCHQYLTYQSAKETRRRRSADEWIARLYTDQQAEAEDQETAIRARYDEQRAAFVARYHAAVASARTHSAC